MTAAAQTAPATTRPTSVPKTWPTRLRWAVSDAAALTGRNLLAYVRLPQLVVFSTIQPIMSVLIFRYVFGGAIQVPGESYVNFLMPGIFVQTVAFGAVGTGVGLAGRTCADLVRNVFVVMLMTAVGFLVGFRVSTGLLGLVAGILLILAFGYALSWIFALVGLGAPNAETAQAMAFPTLFPLVFASSAFVPIESMPGWLQPFADNQPVSVTVDAVRALVLGGPTTSAVLQALAWTVGILAVFAPLAVRRYRRAA
jgi:ABC-2 type transport system permease protein/oleandomycin transport system permease protein